MVTRQTAPTQQARTHVFNSSLHIWALKVQQVRAVGWTRFFGILAPERKVQQKHHWKSKVEVEPAGLRTNPLGNTLN